MIVLNDLYDYNLKIFQDSNKFKFSLDSILLAEYVKVTKKDKTLLDLCSGNAPIPLILAAKYPQLKITGVEIQKEIYELALKSIEFNNLTNNIKMINKNALSIKNYFPGNNLDIVTCNPPFFKVDNPSLINKNYEKALARHEITITLSDIFKLANQMLKYKGVFYLIHRPDRIEEIINEASKNQLAVKEIILISTGKDIIMALFKFIKNGNIGCKISTKIISQEINTYKNIFKKEL